MVVVGPTCYYFVVVVYERCERRIFIKTAAISLVSLRDLRFGVKEFYVFIAM